MRKFVALFLACAVVSTALADNPTAVKKQLAGDYAIFSKSMKAGQIDKMAAYLTDDYVVVEPGGKQATKAQVLQEFKMMSSHLKVAKWDRTIKSVTVSGNTAVAIVNGDFAGQVSGGNDGKTHTMTQNAITKDTWIKTAKGYRLQKSEVQSMTVKVDGKPMNMQRGG